MTWIIENLHQQIETLVYDKEHRKLMFQFPLMFLIQSPQWSNCNVTGNLLRFSLALLA